MACRRSGDGESGEVIKLTPITGELLTCVRYRDLAHRNNSLDVILAPKC